MKRSSWYLRMAWRDSRRNRGRLLLFIASVVIGIAALVSTLSFGRNLREEIDDQAKELLGADLELRPRGPLPDPVRKMVDKDTTGVSKECSFASMVTFVASEQSRLVQVRALEGGFPYYGALETTPAGAGIGFRSEREALVDKTVLLQYHARVGDSIRIGTMTFAIAGSLDRAPGRNELSTTIAPPVYIPLRYAAPAGLLRKGSRVEFQYYYEYEQVPDGLQARLDSAGVRYETVETRKNRMSRSFGDLSEFLTLISFIALLMGCVGVASSVHIYIREKVGDIAVLRCLGLKARGAFLIYLLQIIAIGFIGSLAGVLLGIGIQQV